MICIKTEIPQEICDIDDELKAIYHSKETICIWVFKTRIDRNKFNELKAKDYITSFSWKKNYKKIVSH